MYGFSYDYIKPKYGEIPKLCYMDTDSFIVYIKAENLYSDIAKDVELESSNFELDRPLSKQTKKTM